MAYNINIDNPTSKVRMHNAESKDPRCQIREKKDGDGEWQSYGLREAALQAAESTGFKVALCKICHP